MALDDMTPEQLRALADRKEAEEVMAEVREPQGGADAYDPIAPSGHFSVNVFDMDIDVDVANLDDFELIEDIRKVQGGDVMLTPSVVRRIIGSEQMERVISNLKARNPEHRATMTDMLTVIEAVFTSNEELKN